MTTSLLRPANPYVRAVAESAVEAALGGVWVAAGELATPRRRLARAGLLAAGAGFAAASATNDPDPEDLEDDDDAVEAPRTSNRRPRAAVLVAVAGVSVGLTVGGRMLQKRWLGRLTHQGHRHPHRALGMRMAAISLVCTLPARLLEARGERHSG